MQSITENIDVVYKINVENLALEIENFSPHLRCVADEWGQIEVKRDTTTIATVTIPAVDLHNESVYVSGETEIANLLHSILDGAARGKIKVRYISNVPKTSKRRGQ